MQDCQTALFLSTNMPEGSKTNPCLVREASHTSRNIQNTYTRALWEPQHISLANFLQDACQTALFLPTNMSEGRKTNPCLVRGPSHTSWSVQHTNLRSWIIKPGQVFQDICQKALFLPTKYVRGKQNQSISCEKDKHTSWNVQHTETRAWIIKPGFKFLQDICRNHFLPTKMSEGSKTSPCLVKKPSHTSWNVQHTCIRDLIIKPGQVFARYMSESCFFTNKKCQREAKAVHVSTISRANHHGAFQHTYVRAWILRTTTNNPGQDFSRYSRHHDIWQPMLAWEGALQETGHVTCAICH